MQTAFPKQTHEQGKNFFYMLFHKRIMTDVGWSCCLGGMGWTRVSIFRSLPY